MQGEFRADVTRDTFDPVSGFSRVLMQQGRVLLDADWNEQTSILLNYLRTLASDLFGPFAAFDKGFLVDKKGETTTELKSDFWIGLGHFYIGGLLCENDRWRKFSAQPHYPSSSTVDTDVTQLEAKSYLAYLDAWERHVTAYDYDQIREVALGGPDTATRAQVVWQVRVLEFEPTGTTAAAKQEEAEKFLAAQKSSLSAATMRARAGHAAPSTAPCVISPAARFRGTENQLYRVEVHRGGEAWNGTKDAAGHAAGNVAKAATFKWSRDNASVSLPIRSLSKYEARLATLGQDERHSIHERDWVEISDDRLQGKPGELWQVDKINRDDRIVTFKTRPGQTPRQYTDDDRVYHPVLRRWDHRGDANGMVDGGLLFMERSGEDDEFWISLEDGIQIQFAETKKAYRAGDFWHVPARPAIGNVLWTIERDADGKVVQYPSGAAVPAAQGPRGVKHHYAPLAIVKYKGTGTFDALDVVRRVVAPLGK